MDNKNLKLETGFLFSKSDFLTGIGSVLNVVGNYYEFNTSSSGNEADVKALTSDWYNVGNDIKKAKKKFVRNNSDKLCLK